MLARPNVLMFDDWSWDGSRTSDQQYRFATWFDHAVATPGSALVVVECGAGTAVPTVRLFGDRLAGRGNVRLVRINLRESQVPNGHHGIAGTALTVLHAIDALISAS